MAKVLIVDDEPDIVRIIKARVQSAGHQVVTAANGKLALAMLQDEIPDLIILDVLMPEMDGFQMYKELKQKPLLSKIPVLVVTARGKMEDTFRVIGVDEFISKPFEPEDFMRKVATLLQTKAPASPAPPVKKDAKILLSGSDQEVVAKMVLLLSQAGYTTDTAVSGTDTIAKSMAALPKLILLDVLTDDIPTEEMVKTLRGMTGLQKTLIVLYSFARSEAGEDMQQKLVSIENVKANCLAEGAAGSIGGFNEKTFINAIRPFILKAG